MQGTMQVALFGLFLEGGHVGAMRSANIARDWACGLVAWDGIEPPTRGFSVRCSTS
jgi:hypothetical protein